MSAERLDSGKKRLGQLTLVAAHCPLRTYWLTETRTTIGRRAGNMLVLDDLTVSGEHALLLVTETEAIIQDLDSSNGTLLNGMPVARALLDDGDCIDIGVYRLVFYRNPPEADPDPAAEIRHSGNAPRPGPLPRHRVDPEQLPPLMWLAPGALPEGMSPAGGLPGAGRMQAGGQGGGSSADGAPSDPSRTPAASASPDAGDWSAGGLAQGAHDSAHGAGAGSGAGSAAPSVPGFRPAGGGERGAGFIEGFSWAPRLPPRPLPPARPPRPQPRPPLHQPEDFLGVSLRFLGGHDAGRLLLIDRPIVSIRNGSGQVAVVTRRPGGFFLTHVEGHAYPLVNGESIGLGAHPLRNHDLIELSGTIIQFCQASPEPSS